MHGIYRLHKVYNGPDTTAPEVTQNYIVESGQTGAYWGLGYLKKRNVSGAAAANTVILIEVDYLDDGAVHGMKSIDSYTIDDSLELTSLRNSSSIHTMEIPQVRDKRGRYSDLRECVDFRPMVENTAADATTPAGATLNPASTFNVCHYTGGFKYPKPESDFIYDITYYQGRTDEISVRENGTFNIDSGGQDLQRKDNPNKLVLFRSDVRPYPSLPQVLSTGMKDIIANGVECNGELNERYYRFMNETIDIDPQVRVYTMSEISNLERRIEALEYNQNISELENSTMNRTIQSSVDSTIESFKFGFFVDNFESYALSDRSVDYYAASIYEYVLQPDRISLNLDFDIAKVSSKYRDGNKIVFPYTRKTLISQDTATYAPFVEEPEIEIIEVCEFETNRNKKNVGDFAGNDYTKLQRVWEEFTFIGADQSDGVQRNIELKFYNPRLGTVYEIIQTKQPPTRNSQEVGTSILAPTSATAVALSNTEDAIPLYQKLYPVVNARGQVMPYSTNPWFEPFDSTPTNVNINIAGVPTQYKSYVGTGKFVIPYDHTKGRYITVRVHKARDAETFNFELCYPAITAVDSIYDSGADSVRTREPPCPKGQYKYERCIGTTLVIYGCDGNRGTQVNRRVKNSPKCRIIVAPPPPPPPPTCFIAGTQINMANGTTKNIEDIQVGDKVMAIGGRIDSVTDVHDLSVADHVLYTINGMITATEAHPFMTRDGWKSANPEASRPIYEEYGFEIGQLEVGDMLIGIDGEVELTSLERSEENVQVYNFTTESTHTYAAEGLIVHNKLPPIRCPAAGTFHRNTCSGTTQRVYTFTGRPGSGPGGCSVTVSDTNVNSKACGWKPDPPDPPVCTKPVKPPKPIVTDDDGCVAVVDPECSIETAPPKPPVKPPLPPKPVKNPTPPCFVGGTKIDMADGSQKNIEDIVVGDEVKAMEGQTDTVAYVHDIEVQDHVLWTLNGHITATEAHPFLTTEGWKSANPVASMPIYSSYGIPIDQLQIGDMLIGAEGEVELTTFESREENVKVYNFSTASTHTYMVDGIVSHNKKPPPPPKPVKPAPPPKPPAPKTPPPPPKPIQTPPPPPKPPKVTPAPKTPPPPPTKPPKQPSGGGGMVKNTPGAGAGGSAQGPKVSFK